MGKYRAQSAFSRRSTTSCRSGKHHAARTTRTGLPSGRCGSARGGGRGKRGTGKAGRDGESGTGTILTRWGVLDYGSAMPRTARVAPGGMVFHVLNRGVARMQLFEKAADYQAFEQVLQDTLDQSPMQICAYAVMPNHWHLLLWPECDGELAAFMQRLTITHVRRWQEHSAAYRPQPNWKTGSITQYEAIAQPFSLAQFDNLAQKTRLSRLVVQRLCGIGPCLLRSIQVVPSGKRRAFLGCGPIR